MRLLCLSLPDTVDQIGNNRCVQWGIVGNWAGSENRDLSCALLVAGSRPPSVALFPRPLLDSSPANEVHQRQSEG